MSIDRIKNMERNFRRIFSNNNFIEEYFYLDLILFTKLYIFIVFILPGHLEIVFLCLQARRTEIEITTQPEAICWN